MSSEKYVFYFDLKRMLKLRQLYKVKCSIKWQASLTEPFASKPKRILAKETSTSVIKWTSVGSTSVWEVEMLFKCSENSSKISTKSKNCCHEL